MVGWMARGVAVGPTRSCFRRAIAEAALGRLALQLVSCRVSAQAGQATPMKGPSGGSARAEMKGWREARYTLRPTHPRPWPLPAGGLLVARRLPPLVSCRRDALERRRGRPCGAPYACAARTRLHARARARAPPPTHTACGMSSLLTPAPSPLPSPRPRPAAAMAEVAAPVAAAPSARAEVAVFDQVRARGWGGRRRAASVAVAAAGASACARVRATVRSAHPAGRARWGRSQLRRRPDLR